MTMPFYSSVDQLLRDRSELARKGIARGRSVVVLTYTGGVLFVAENRSTTLHKVSEIYDRIGFAAVGRYNEFETLRNAGIRMADVRGYSYDRRDVTGRTTLPRLAALLSACDVMVANDTGPLHLAAALGRPCVAPYTCTRVALHGPYGSAGGVETSVPCAASYLKQCPHGMVCMPDLTADKLWPPLSQVLETWSANFRSG